MGDVAIVEGTPPEPWQDVQVGDEWTVSYVFDSEAPDLSPNPLTGRYAIESLHVGIAGEVVPSIGMPEIQIDVFGGIYDAGFSELANGAGGSLVLEFDGTTFPGGDALPRTLDLDDFLREESFLYMQDALKSFSILGSAPHSLDISVVPAPGAFVPLIFLVGGCFTSRRRLARAR